MTGPVVIVGAGLGGVRTAESLRTGGYTGDIVLIGDEAHPPYDRPPLSKSVVTGDHDRVDLKPADFFTDQRVDLRTHARVVAVDTDAQTVTVDRDGTDETVDYGTLVLATGLTARRLPGVADDITGVHVIRTIDDALAVRDAAGRAHRAVVVGAGFIGCEIASSLRSLDVPVAVIEPAPTPLAAVVGERIGRLVTRLHRDADVELRTGVGVDSVETRDGAVSAVLLSDGTREDADLVIVGIGGHPDLEYLAGSSIAVADRADGGGIACDEVGRTGVPGVYALGDAANWLDEHGVRHRAEHWNHTIEQAAIVAADVAGRTPAPRVVPYFWSDQYGLKIQMLGDPRSDDDVHLIDDDGRNFLAYYSRDGLLTGVIGAGRVGKLMKTRRHLQIPTQVADLLA